MEWYWWVLIGAVVNFVGGYGLGVLSLFLFQKTEGLMKIREASAGIKIFCFILWPLAVEFLLLADYSSPDFIKNKERRFGSLFISGSDSAEYLGQMTLMGLAPKIICIICSMIGACLHYLLYLTVEKIPTLPVTLGRAIKPKFINGDSKAPQTV